MYLNPSASSAAQLTKQSRSAAVIPASEITAWVTRELQAILLEQDVHLVCQVALGTAASLAKSLLSTGTRYLQRH